MAKLSYCELVRPDHPVTKIALAALGATAPRDLSDDLFATLWTWYRSASEGVALRDRYVREIAAGADLGRCFGTSVFGCAILRGLQIDADRVFVIVGCHRGEDFQNALHASLAWRVSGGIWLVDLDKSAENEARIVLPSLRAFARHTSLVCAFNDQTGEVGPEDWPAPPPVGPDGATDRIP